MLFIWRSLGSVLTLFSACMCAPGQAVPAVNQPAPEESKIVEAVPRVPGVSTLFSGFNAGVTYSAVHNSSVGWYSVLTPALNYTFSRRFSGDLSTALYFHRNIQNQNPATARTQPLVLNNVSAGDTLIGFHATFLPGSLIDMLSVYVTAPTGETSAGLGTGHVTFDVSNHAERYIRKVGFLVDVGGGNSSNVFNNQVTRNYSSSGGLAHFQGGGIIWLPGHSYFESAAYEQLPIGNQTVYTSVRDPDRPPQPRTKTTFAEDNGIVSFAGMPLTDHLMLTGYYDRSFRRRADTVSIGITYVLRGTGWKRRLSTIDEALREAEKSGQ